MNENVTFFQNILFLFLLDIISLYLAHYFTFKFLLYVFIKIEIPSQKYKYHKEKNYVNHITSEHLYAPSKENSLVLNIKTVLGKSNILSILLTNHHAVINVIISTYMYFPIYW